MKWAARHHWPPRCRQPCSLCSIKVPSSKDHKFTPVQLMLRLISKGKETNLSLIACSSFITSLINFFDLKNYTKVDCAFHYWAEQNSAMAGSPSDSKNKKCINSIRQWCFLCLIFILRFHSFTDKTASHVAVK